jgi:hypothetical protein
MRWDRKWQATRHRRSSIRRAFPADGLLTGLAAMPMLEAMSTSADNTAGDESNAARQETIGGMLASALNMEDDISSGVYQDYLKRRHWPEQFEEDAFLNIKRRLTMLIDDTKKHKKILQVLVREHGANT